MPFLVVCIIWSVRAQVREKVEFHHNSVGIDVNLLNILVHKLLHSFECAALERYSYLLKRFRKLSFRRFALLLGFYEIGKLPRSELPLYSLENIFAHDRLIYVISDYPLGFVLGAAAVADKLRHTFVADTFPMKSGIGMASNLAEYQKGIMVR